MSAEPGDGGALAHGRASRARPARPVWLALMGALLSGCVAASVDDTGRVGATEVDITPRSSVLRAGDFQLFTCKVTGAVDSTCTWSVLEGTSGGVVTSAGAYTAPAEAGTYHVVATSRADPARSATSTVMVASGGTSSSGGPAAAAGRRRGVLRALPGESPRRERPPPHRSPSAARASRPGPGR